MQRAYLVIKLPGGHEMRIEYMLATVCPRETTPSFPYTVSIHVFREGKVNVNNRMYRVMGLPFQP